MITNQSPHVAMLPSASQPANVDAQRLKAGPAGVREDDDVRPSAVGGAVRQSVLPARQAADRPWRCVLACWVLVLHTAQLHSKAALTHEIETKH